jgi:hypothetical protein
MKNTKEAMKKTPRMPMKKTPQKLILRSQTLRVLANTELSRAMGGDPGARGPAVVDSHDVACPTTFAAGATANCR